MLVSPFPYLSGDSRRGSHVPGGHSGLLSLAWGGQKSHPLDLVSEAMFVVKCAHVNLAPEFGPISSAEAALLSVEAGRLSAKYDVTVTADSLASLRIMETSLAVMQCGGRLQRRHQELLQAYERGASVLELATKHRLPPSAVLRFLLSAEGYGKKTISKMCKNTELLPPKFAVEVGDVFRRDICSGPNSTYITLYAKAFEDILTSCLRNLGIKFRTEDEIKASVPITGPVPPTPDILLDEPLLVDGHLVHWFDAKAYPWYGSRLVAKKLAEQADKYAKSYGQGAFVFKGGVAHDILLATTAPLLLLDGSHIVGC